MSRSELRRSDLVRAILILTTALVLAGPAPAREGVRLAAGEWSVHGGLGFASDPGGVLLATGVEVAVADFLAVGPLLQLGLDDDHTLVAPTLNFRFGIDLSDVDNEFVRRLEPFVQTGLGFAYLEKERRGTDRHDTGFLINGGVGAQYWVTDDLAVGSSLLLNGMPDDVAGEDFFASWQAVTLRYRF